jgi:hypothetical protein
MLDRRSAKPRDNLPQARRHQLLPSHWGARGVAHPATEQQAMVGAESKVNQLKVGVSYRRVGGNQLPAQGSVQRRSADHVGADWQDAGHNVWRHL